MFRFFVISGWVLWFRCFGVVVGSFVVSLFRYFGVGFVVSWWGGVFVISVCRYFREGFVGVLEFLCRGVYIVAFLFGVGW